MNEWVKKRIRNGGYSDGDLPTYIQCFYTNADKSIPVWDRITTLHSHVLSCLLISASDLQMQYIKTYERCI